MVGWDVLSSVSGKYVVFIFVHKSPICAEKYFLATCEIFVFPQATSWTQSGTAMAGKRCLSSTSSLSTLSFSSLSFSSSSPSSSVSTSKHCHHQHDNDDQVSLDYDLLSFKLTNLSCGSVYSFNLVAHNIAGRSKPRSVFVIVRTSYQTRLSSNNQGGVLKQQLLFLKHQIINRDIIIREVF